MNEDGLADLIINDTKNGAIYVAYNTTIISDVKEENNTHIDIYPNPTKDFINLDNNLVYDTYQIVAMDGSIVKKGTHTNRIDINLLASGQYVLILSANDQQVARSSFVKE